MAAVTLSVLPDQALAGLFFKDIRPRDFPTNRILDIHVGKLISSSKMANAVDFYHLNYCASSGTHHFNQNAETIDPSSTVEGVTMYDTDLHESFLQVSLSKYLNY